MPLGAKLLQSYIFATDPIIGVDAAAADPIWYGGGIHTTLAGRARIATIYTLVPESLLLGSAALLPTPLLGRTDRTRGTGANAGEGFFQRGPSGNKRHARLVSYHRRG